MRVCVCVSVRACVCVFNLADEYNMKFNAYNSCRSARS